MDTQTEEIKTPEVDKELVDQELVKKILHWKRVARYSYTLIAEKAGKSPDEIIAICAPYIKVKKLQSKFPKNLSATIIKRFLKGTDLEDFYKNYKAFKLKAGGFSREAILKQPITKEEIDFLKIYTQDFTTEIKQFAKDKGIPLGSFYNKVQRVSVRIIAQYPHILDEVKTQG